RLPAAPSPRGPVRRRRVPPTAGDPADATLRHRASPPPRHPVAALPRRRVTPPLRRRRLDSWSSDILSSATGSCGAPAWRIGIQEAPSWAGTHAESQSGEQAMRPRRRLLVATIMVLLLA